MLGRSIWSVLNSYYAVLKEKQYYPDEIILFTEGKKTDTLKSNTKTTTTGLKIISESFGITPRIISEHLSEIEYDIKYGDFIKAGKEISKLIQKRNKDGDTVAIDITPGKKTLVAGALLPIHIEEVDHIYYLSIKTIIANPYMMIPYQTQQINDFIEQAQKAVGQ